MLPWPNAIKWQLDQLLLTLMFACVETMIILISLNSSESSEYVLRMCSTLEFLASRASLET